MSLLHLESLKALGHEGDFGKDEGVSYVPEVKAKVLIREKKIHLKG